MSNEYPLFPQLPEEAQKEAVQLLGQFKDEMRKIADQVISDFYSDIMPYIESDTWTNFRNELLVGFKDYGNRKVQAEYDFKSIRQAIYRLHRDEIIADLNQDLVEEVKALKHQVAQLQSARY